MAQISQGYGIKWQGEGKKSLLWTTCWTRGFTGFLFRMRLFVPLSPLLWPKSWRTDWLLIESSEWWLSRWPLTLSETKDFLFWRCGDEKEKEKKNIWKWRSWDGFGRHPLQTFLKSEKPYFFFQFPPLCRHVRVKRAAAPLEWTGRVIVTFFFFFFLERPSKVTLQEVKISATAGNIEPVCFLPIFQMQHHWQLPNRHRRLEPVAAILESRATSKKKINK